MTYIPGWRDRREVGKCAMFLGIPRHDPRSRKIWWCFLPTGREEVQKKIKWTVKTKQFLSQHVPPKMYSLLTFDLRPVCMYLTSCWMKQLSWRKSSLPSVLGSSSDSTFFSVVSNTPPKKLRTCKCSICGNLWRKQVSFRWGNAKIILTRFNTF